MNTFSSASLPGSTLPSTNASTDALLTSDS